MKLLSALVAFAVLVPSADAAIVSTTKQKKLPTLVEARVSEDLREFGFDVKKAPTTNAYDIWGRLVNRRGEVVAEWFVKSMKLRHRSTTKKHAAFRSNLAQILAFEKPGTYVFTLFACPANLREPSTPACASTSTTFEFGAKKAK